MTKQELRKKLDDLVETTSPEKLNDLKEMINKLSNLNDTERETYKTKISDKKSLAEKKDGKKFSVLKRNLNKFAAVGAFVLVTAVAFKSCNYLQRFAATEEETTTTSMSDSVINYDAASLFEKESVQSVINQSVAFANDVRAKGSEMTAEEALAIVCSINGNIDTRIIRASVFNSATDELKYYNSGMEDSDELLIKYCDIADFSLLFKKQNEIDWHKKLQTSVVTYLNATTDESRKTAADEISALYEQRYAEGTNNIQSEAIPLDIEIAFTLKGISKSMGWVETVKNDTYALMLKDNEKVNCDEETINNWYSEFTASRRVEASESYDRAQNDMRTIGLDAYESSEFGEKVITAINSQLVEVNVREAAENSAYNKDISPDGNGKGSSGTTNFPTGGKKQIVDGVEVIVIPGDDYKDDALGYDKNGNPIISESTIGSGSAYTPNVPVASQEEVDKANEALKQDQANAQAEADRIAAEKQAAAEEAARKAAQDAANQQAAEEAAKAAAAAEAAKQAQDSGFVITDQTFVPAAAAAPQSVDVPAPIDEPAVQSVEAPTVEEPVAETGGMTR